MENMIIPQINGMGMRVQVLSTVVTELVEQSTKAGAKVEIDIPQSIPKEAVSNSKNIR